MNWVVPTGLVGRVGQTGLYLCVFSASSVSLWCALIFTCLFVFIRGSNSLVAVTFRMQWFFRRDGQGFWSFQRLVWKLTHSELRTQNL